MTADQEQAAYELLNRVWEVIAQTKTLVRRTKLLLADTRAEIEAQEILHKG